MRKRWRVGATSANPDATWSTAPSRLLRSLRSLCRSRAVARAVVAQRRSLVMTSAPSLADSLRAHVMPLPWVWCHRPSAAPSVTASSSLSFLVPAAAANPSASLQGGLAREAAVGRARAECCFAKVIGAPSSPRLQRGEGLAPRLCNIIRGSDAPNPRAMRLGAASGTSFVRATSSARREENIRP